MRIFLAGASGVLGIRLIPLMVAQGYSVVALTRSQGKVEKLRTLGAQPILCDVFDRNALIAAVQEARPDVLMHQVTDLPDDAQRLPEFRALNQRVRSEGTANLLAAARAAHHPTFIAQSVAWPIPGTEAHEHAVLAYGGTVLRYGQFYGPGTYYEKERPPLPRIHIDEAARQTMQHLSPSSGIITISETE